MSSSFILQAAGTLLFAFLLGYLGYPNLFFLLAILEVGKLLAVFAYRESRKERVDRKISLKEAYSFKIEKNLKVLSVSSAIGSLGFGIAHGFLLPLYLMSKYGLDAYQMSLVTAVHRLSFMTTPLADKFIGRLGLRRTYILSLSAYVVSFLSVGLITFPILIFVPIFLIHDLLGGGIGSTAMNVIMQNHTNEKTRAREFNAFNAVQTPIVIIAPSIASILAAASWDYIFIVGGLLYLVSLIVFSLVFKD